MKANSAWRITTSRLLALFVIAFGVRLLYISRLDNSTIGTWGDQGADIALNMLHGRGYVMSFGLCQNFHSFRMPAAPLLLYGVWSVVGFNVLAAKVAMAIISALTCVIVVKLGERLFDERTAWLAGLAVAIIPEFIRWSGTLGAENIAMFFLAAGAYAWTIATPSRWLLSGILLTVAALGRPALLPGILLLAIITFSTLRKSRPPATIGYAFCLVAGIAIAWLPWIARNAVIHHTLVPTSTEGGLTFLEANNPVAWRSGSNWVPGYSTTLPDIVQQAKQLNEVELDRLFYRRGWEFVRRDPAAYVRAWALRIKYLWQPIPHLRGDLSRAHTILIGLIWTPLLLLAAWTVWRHRLWKEVAHRPVFTSFISISLASALVWSQNRYRAPVDTFVVLYAMRGLVDIRNKVALKSTE